MTYESKYKIEDVEQWIKVAKKRNHTHIKVVMGFEPYTGIEVKNGWNWLSIE